MTANVLRWGLLSTARINHALIPPLRASARNQLLAVASRRLEQAEAYARQWAIPRAFGSYEAMLADPEIDVIYNSLPNGLHAEWSIRAAQAGKHVLCEKPLAISLDEVDAIARAAQAAGVVIAEAFMYRHHPQTLAVKALVEGGAIGQIRLMRGSFSFNLTRQTDVRLEPGMGGGCLWDVGCYPVSLARTLAGAEPAEVFGWQVTGNTGVDEVFVGQLRFAGKPDVYAQFDCSFRAPLRTYFEIVGSEGVINIPSPFVPGASSAAAPDRSPTARLKASLPEEIKEPLRQLAARLPRGPRASLLEREARFFLVRESGMEEFTLPRQDVYSGEVEDMADAVLLGKPPRLSLTDSRGNVATLLALLRSAQQGRPELLFRDMS